MAIDSEVSIVGYTVGPTNVYQRELQDWPAVCRFRGNCREIVESGDRGAASAREPFSSGLSGRLFRESNMLINGLPDACFDKFLGDTSVG